MGAGKTRIGKRVAKLLDVPFVDTDKRIVAEVGPIPAIFAEHGEAHFRTLERKAVAAALSERAVVSLGGGAPMDSDTHRLLLHQNVALLTITKEAVASRILGEGRPMLTAGITSWIELTEKRMPVYSELASHTWDTSTRPAEHIAQEIADWATERDS